MGTNDVTNAPLLPGKDPLTPGKQTTEFLGTITGMFVIALVGALAAFDVLHLTEERKAALYELLAMCFVALPVAYAFARSYVKGKAVQNASAPAQQDFNRPL